MKLRYERGALADLDEIFAYIAADNPEAAARLVARIEERGVLPVRRGSALNIDDADRQGDAASAQRVQLELV